VKGQLNLDQSNDMREQTTVFGGIDKVQALV
jgi:hypothetical protein